jgi:hypothetical protein
MERLAALPVGSERLRLSKPDDRKKLDSWFVHGASEVITNLFRSEAHESRADLNSSRLKLRSTWALDLLSGEPDGALDAELSRNRQMGSAACERTADDVG